MIDVLARPATITKPVSMAAGIAYVGLTTSSVMYSEESQPVKTVTAYWQATRKENPLLVMPVTADWSCQVSNTNWGLLWERGRISIVTEREKTVTRLRNIANEQYSLTILPGADAKMPKIHRIPV